MRKSELKKAADSEIIVDYINSYAMFSCNVNMGGGIKALSAHLKDLDAEMLRRGILSAEQIKRLND